MPYLAAIIIQVLAKYGVPWFDAEQITMAVTFIVATVYYAIFRWIELISQDPRTTRLAGWLLGYPRKKVPVDV